MTVLESRQKKHEKHFLVLGTLFSSGTNENNASVGQRRCNSGFHTAVSMCKIADDTPLQTETLFLFHDVS